MKSWSIFLHRIASLAPALAVFLPLIGAVAQQAASVENGATFGSWVIGIVHLSQGTMLLGYRPAPGSDPMILRIQLDGFGDGVAAIFGGN